MRGREFKNHSRLERGLHKPVGEFSVAGRESCYSVGGERGVSGSASWRRIGKATETQTPTDAGVHTALPETLSLVGCRDIPF